MYKPEMIEILERTQTGEYCPSKEWDKRRIPTAIHRKLKEHGLAKTFTREDPVNCDDELADAFYKAGYELALEVGMFCENTERIVKVSEEELNIALDLAPSEIFVGEGKDGTWIRTRVPEDPYPMPFGASMAIMLDEDLWPLVTEGIIREREVDIISGPSLIKIYGRDVLTGTPFETLAGYVNAKLNRQLREKAGRPGMGAIAIPSATSEFGQFGGYAIPGGYRTSDLALCLFPSEMKINYSVLNKVVHTVNNNGYVFTGSPAMVSGMPGPPEGAVVSAIACTLLQYAVLHASAGGGEIYDVRQLTNVNREGLWTLSTANQALSRNTHLLTHAIANEVSGPCTESFLLESLVGVSTIAASGVAIAAGPRPAGGKLANYITPLECRFAAEVSHKASGLTRKTVNEIAKEILPRYEDRITDPDVGKPFVEAYDIKTMRPTKEWESIYRKVKAEAISLGVPLSEY
jgi:methylamine---corrinoid protein Co-methyltransferase